MKKLAVILMAFLAVGMMMTSCTKDYEELIIGTWKVDVEASYNHEIITDELGTNEDTYSLKEAGCESATFTFKEDGTMVVESVYDVYYDVYEDELERDVETLHYVIEDGRVIVSEEEQYDIQELDKKNLVLHASGESTFEFSAGGSYQWEVHFVMTRQ